MEAQPQKEPANLVEHMKYMLEPFGNYDAAIPDMLTEYFYQFVEQTIKIAHSKAAAAQPAQVTTVLRNEDINIACEVMSQNVQPQQSQIMVNASIINESNIKFDATLEVVSPPEEVSMQKTNFQVGKAMKNPKTPNGQ